MMADYSEPWQGALFATATIAAGQSLSDAVVLRGNPGGVQLPADINSATKISFQLSYDGGTTYGEMYQSGANTEISVAVSKAIPLEPKDFWSATHLKVRLGTAAVPVVAPAGGSALIFGLVP